MRTSLAIIHQPQHQRVQPQACEGNEPFPCRWRAGKEEPPLALVRPRRRAPTLRCIGRSEEHTSELQSRFDLVCRLLLEKKKKNKNTRVYPDTSYKSTSHQ